MNLGPQQSSQSRPSTNGSFVTPMDMKSSDSGKAGKLSKKDKDKDKDKDKEKKKHRFF